MEEEYKNYPFYDWVPKPLGIIFMIILFVPMITMSGVYSANSGEMMSGLGIQSEYIAFAGFCTSIGMAAFSPFFYELVCIRREKMMCIVGFSILFLLSFVCAQTDSLFILGLCSQQFQPRGRDGERPGLVSLCGWLSQSLAENRQLHGKHRCQCGAYRRLHVG